MFRARSNLVPTLSRVASGDNGAEGQGGARADLSEVVADLEEAVREAEAGGFTDFDPGTTAMAALGAVGSGGSPEGPERSEGAAKRLDAPLPAAHRVSYVVNQDVGLRHGTESPHSAAFNYAVESSSFRGGDAVDAIAVSRADSAEAVWIWSNG